MRITDKTVLITGASSGIGAAIARAVSAAGAAWVVLLAGDEQRLKTVADEIEAAGAKASPYSVDLSVPVAVEAVVQCILDEVGAPDILIDNAGSGRWRFLQDMERIGNPTA